MTELTPHVGVEALISEIGRHPNVDEVHVREHTEWAWTRHDPDNEGIRYSTGAALAIVSSVRPGREIGVARFILADGSHDRVITHFELAEDEPYAVVKIAAAALR